MKAQINAQWKVIRGAKEQLAHVVKEQKRKTEQKKNWTKRKKLNRRKKFKRKKKLNRSEERLTTYQKKRETSRKVFI